MTKHEFDMNQCHKQCELAKETPITEIEKDIWKLKHLRYSIRCGSFQYRHGFIKTLDRAIARLEAENDQN